MSRDPNLMPVIDGNGAYDYEPNSMNLVISAHPVYKARIDLGLPVNTWLYAPLNGHDMEDYKRVKETEANIQKFQKDLLFYLDAYGPVVTEKLGVRGAVSMNLEIAEDALDV